MSKTAVVFTCAHSEPEVSNQRFDWLGSLIHDIKPDYVIDLGDGADMRSLNSYDTKYPRAVVSQNYEEDIDCYLDSQERLRHKIKKSRKKRPMWIGFEGNHENRIKKALKLDPRTEGQKYGVSFKHLETEEFFDEYHEYENGGPAIANYDGILYAHYFSSGNYGTATSGIHHAYSIIQNNYLSSTCGHSHKRSQYFKDGAGVNGIIGSVIGCYKGAEEDWAGQANNEWWSGVLIKRNIDNGMFDPQWVSISKLKDEYHGKIQ